MIKNNPFLERSYTSSSYSSISENPFERVYFPYTKRDAMKPGFLISNQKQYSRTHHHPSYDPKSPYSTFSSYVSLDQPSRVNKSPILNPFYKTHLLSAQQQIVSSRYSYGNYQTYAGLSAGDYSVYNQIHNKGGPVANTNANYKNSTQGQGLRYRQRQRQRERERERERYRQKQNDDSSKNLPPKTQSPKKKDSRSQEEIKDKPVKRISEQSQVTSSILQNIYGIGMKKAQSFGNKQKPMSNQLKTKRKQYQTLNQQDYSVKQIKSQDQDPLNDNIPSFVVKIRQKKDAIDQTNFPESPRWGQADPSERKKQLLGKQYPNSISYQNVTFYLKKINQF